MRPWPRRDRMTLPDRLRALEEVLSVGAGRLPDDVTEQVQTTLDRSGERRELSVEHTVVALAGATGSGKSSLFNTLAGMEVSRVGVRRPTTSEPMACVWGTQGVAPLLEWLGVPGRRQVARESVLDSGAADELDGLVLLDLPDHDSTEPEHRDTVDRLVELVDLFVWVLDPQKYADAVLHDRYLRPLATHQAVTVVVLNQIDRLPHGGVVECVTDLRAHLEDDGLDDVPVVALSAVTGDGMETLIDIIRTAVTKRRSMEERIEADTRSAAETVAAAVGDGEPADTNSTQRKRLVEALAEASGTDVVAEAVGRSYLLRARAATGWPLTRWVSRFRRDPLTRLGVGSRWRGADTGDVRVSLPEPTSVQRARADAAVRAFGDAAAGTLRGPWRDAVRGAVTDAAQRLPGALDRAVESADLEIGRKPAWWRVMNLLQWLSLLTALGGGAWLLALAGTSFLRLDVSDPQLAGFPVPTLMLGGGLALGIVLGVLGLAAARKGGRRRAAAVGAALHEVVDRTAGEVVVGPVAAEIERYRGFRRALDRARSD